MPTAKSLRLAGAARDEIAFVFAGDEAFARGLAVAMHSALTALRVDFRPDVYVLDNGLSAASRTRVVNVFQATKKPSDLRWIRVPIDRLPPAADGTHLSSAAYSRLLIPELLPKHVRRVVYLDGDVLVRADLSPLFEMELVDTPVGAVRDFSGGTTAHENAGIVRLMPNFNTGVLIVDVPGWRNEQLGERVLRYAAASPEPLPCGDQDALNALVDNWCELDYRWNVQHANLFLPGRQAPSEFSDRIYRQRWELYHAAAILHWVGAIKPWVHWCQTPGTLEWIRALMQSGWYSRHEGTVWLLNWLGRRTRYRLGTTRRRLAAHRSATS